MVSRAISASGNRGLVYAETFTTILNDSFKLILQIIQVPSQDEIQSDSPEIRCDLIETNLFQGYYETGDMAIRDNEGRFQIAGRMDDVINIAGHRISTAEIEDCVSTHTSVSESAVISIPHDIKGTNCQTVNY